MDTSQVVGSGSKDYSPPKVDRIWGIWESYYNIPKAIFYLLKGDYRDTKTPLKSKLRVSMPMWEDRMVYGTSLFC